MALEVTGGEVADISLACTLVEEDFNCIVTADRGYDSDAFRSSLAQKNITPVIPGRKNRNVAIVYDKELYKNRHVVENFFLRIKRYRRIATRYDKTKLMFSFFLTLASIFIWLETF